MSKKGKNTHFPEKIKGNLFDVDNEEDISELKNINSLLSHSKESLMENDDNNNDLNNRTNVSDRDNISENEKKEDTTLKSRENILEENENGNSEIVLKDKNFLVEDIDSQLKSDDEKFEINEINKNININLFINDIESKINKNINIENKINKSNFNNKDSLLTEKKEAEKENLSNERKRKSPIFFIRKIKKRSKRIQFLRKKKGIHLKRKNNADIIRKKIKTYFHNYLIYKLNKEIKISNWKKLSINLESHFRLKKVKKKKINKFLKFNNKFTTNVSINLNKKLLLKKISDILIEEPISSKYKSFNIKNNYYLTKYLLSLQSIPHIHKILNSKYEEFFNEFLKSSDFQKILKNIENKDGKQYLDNFKKVCFNLTSFYNKAKQKITHKIEKPKKKLFSVKKVKNDKEESKRSKKSKKSKRSISFFQFNKTPNYSEEYKFKSFSSIYLHSIKSEYNIISLNENFSFSNINSKNGSEPYDKSSTFNDMRKILDDSINDDFFYNQRHNLFF